MEVSGPSAGPSPFSSTPRRKGRDVVERPFPRFRVSFARRDICDIGCVRTMRAVCSGPVQRKTATPKKKAPKPAVARARLESPFPTADAAQTALASAGYIADREIAVVAHLAGALGKPLLLEGPAGVGKTELAKAIARATGRSLVRLQCYEGLDESKALYEWEYSKQILYTQLVRDVLSKKLRGVRSVREAVAKISEEESAFFDERFLISRPLLAAVRAPRPVVLLIDEVDRSDPEFEALLLEVLSDFQVTVPEIGTLTATAVPFVVLTSNATRDLTEALRRRCLYLHLDYPTPTRELAILRQHVPEAHDSLTADVVRLMERVRKLDLQKAPSVAEAVEWTRALVLLGASELTADLVRDTLATLAKYEADRARIRDHVTQHLKR